MVDTSNQQQPPMGYVRLGRSGLKVSKVILGCMTYGSSKWDDWVLDEEKGMEHIKAAYDLGINAFDTANLYSNGLSEVVLGKAIKKYNLPRDEIVVMTKFCYAVPRDPDFSGWLLAGPTELDTMRYTNQYGASRKHIFEAIKHSLQRLQLDYVDVYQLHRFDPNTPIEETMQALHDVVKAGYARYIGMSSCYAWQFHKMQAYAREHGLTQFISMQNYHNAVYREEEREMTPLLQDMGVGMIPWSPLARGFLTRPIEAETTRGQSDMFWKVTGWDAAKDEPSLEINKRVAEIAKKYGVSMAQIALAWSLSKPFMTAPIIGTSSLEKLKDTIRGANLRLSEEDIKAIDEPYKPKPITGHY